VDVCIYECVCLCVGCFCVNVVHVPPCVWQVSCMSANDCASQLSCQAVPSILSYEPPIRLANQKPCHYEVYILFDKTAFSYHLLSYDDLYLAIARMRRFRTALRHANLAR
jgi:hypothetical protein